MERTKRITKRISNSAGWVAYILIIFKMIYMSTAFVLFFYSIYDGMPLAYLNKDSSTSWLVQNVLPHFTRTEQGKYANIPVPLF